MTKFEVSVLQIRDNSFNIGMKLGQEIKHKSMLKTYEMMTKPEIDYHEMKAVYSAIAPHLLDELNGVAEGLGISLKKSMALFSGYDLPKVEAMGCSAFITNDYYVRNYDFSPDLYDGYFTLLQPEKSFASAGYNLQVLGRHDGVNSHGLVLGFHFVSNNDYCKGLSAWMAVRMILDTCTSLDDAIYMLKEIPHAACYNFSIGDGKGKIAVVEASPQKIVVRRDEVLTCVNHFQNNELSRKNRLGIEGSIKRDNYLQNCKTHNLTFKQMFDKFRDKNSPMFFTDYDQLFGTLHTFSYSFKDAQILTAIAQSKQVLEIDFQEWAKGKNIDNHMLEGSIIKKEQK